MIRANYTISFMVIILFITKQLSVSTCYPGYTKGRIITVNDRKTYNKIQGILFASPECYAYTYNGTITPWFP